MKPRKLVLNAVLLLLFSGSFSGYGQEATLSAGGDATGINGTVAYSIGQVFYTEQQSDYGRVNQGVQQVYDKGSLSIGTDVNLQGIVVFPNPTRDNMQICLPGGSANGWSYRICDQAGREVQAGRIQPGQELQLGRFHAGIYSMHLAERGVSYPPIRIIRY